MTEQLTYSSRATAIRETAKWIAVIFMGTGAVLFSGLSFTNMVNLASNKSWYLLIPLSVFPVIAAIWVIREATLIITYRPPDVGRILPDFAAGVLGRSETADAELRKKLEDTLPATVATYGGVSQYEQRLLSAHGAVERAVTRSRLRR